MSNRNSPDLLTLARRAVQVEVSLLRTPLLLTDRVATRLGAGDAVHAKVRAGLAVLDAVADRVADAPPKRSTTPPADESADAPAAEATPESAAEATPESAAEATPEPADEPIAEPVTTAVAAAPDEEPVSESKDELVEHVAEELLGEEELAPLAGELAENDELRRVQAELNAKRLVEEQHERPAD